MREFAPGLRIFTQRVPLAHGRRVMFAERRPWASSTQQWQQTCPNPSVMVQDKKLDTIRNQGLLKDLDPHHLHMLADLALDAHFEPDQVLFHEGDATNLFYLIVSGSVALEVSAPARRILVQTLHAGDAMGWSSLLEDGHKHFQARALSPVTALAFEGAVLREACERDLEFGYAMMKRLLAVLVQRLDASRHQFADGGIAMDHHE